MKYTTFNCEHFDSTKEHMFFGKPVSISRFDKQKFSIFEKLIEKQLSFFWRPEEVDLSKDRKDFMELSDAEKHIFTSNLKYQTLLDSVQGRSPNVAFLPVISIPELETWVETWAFSETIHSRSYTHIMKNIYVDPTKEFDSIVLDKKIIERAESVTSMYDKFIHMQQEYNVLGDESGITLYDLKEQLVLTILSVNILEAVRFYVSFACSFAFAERAVMEGNAKIIKLIARDEALHLVGTQQILNLFANGKDDPEMAGIMNKIRKNGVVYDMFMDAADQEKEWADYLFKDGSMVGLNADILKTYVEYITNERLGNLGYEPVYPVLGSTPLPWMDTWLNSETVQVAPQEVEISSYLSGQVDAKVDIGSFADITI